MKLTFDDTSGTPIFVIEHGGVTLEWDAKEYNTSARGNILNEINGYWSTLPSARSEAIWEIYKKIYYVVNEVYDLNQLHGQLVGLVKDLYVQHPMEEIEYWMTVKGNIGIPPGLEEEYTNADKRFFERTYLAGDYRGLMVLAVSLRPMLPIWSEYLKKVKSQLNNRDKEYVAMRLLSRSSIVSSKPLLRFKRYVEASITAESSTIASVMGALGTEETPEWLMSIGVVKSLVVGEVGVTSDGSTLISNVYNKMITNTLNVLDRKFGGRVRDKLPRDGYDEDKASIIENYKMKQEVSDGDIVAVGVYADEAVRTSMHLDPEVPESLVRECLSNIMTFKDFDVQQHHLTFTQWVVSSVIPPRGVPAMSYQTLMRTMAVAQAHLFHRGMNEMATLITATMIKVDPNSTNYGTEERPRLDKETTEKLLALYPHYQKPHGSKSGTDRQQNPAIKAIDILTKELIRCQWRVNLTPALKELNKGKSLLIDRSSRLTVSATLRYHLAEFIIDNNTRRKIHATTK